jgi:PAS domain S-box-containing protein
MAAMVGFIGLFLYSNINLKSKITYKIVQQTEMITSLLTTMSTDILGAKHDKGRYDLILQYGDVVGVNDIGIYTPDGKEAFGNLQPNAASAPAGQSAKVRDIQAQEMSNFLNAVKTSSKKDFFDHEKKTYTGYIPLKSKGVCVECHKNSGETLGILAIKLSTEEDFALLNSVQSLIWKLAFIVLIPIVGMIVAFIVSREKSRLYSKLSKSNEDLKNTFNSLNETKHYLQLILDNSKAIIITTDKDGNIVEFNKEAQKLFEYSKEDVVGKSVLMLYQDPSQRLEMLKNANESNSGSWAVKNREVRLKSKSGKVVYINISLSALTADDGSAIGTVGVGKDVSEQRMLQFKLLQSEKLAGIGILAAGIAHEINNPLAGILGMAEAIRDENDPVLAKSYSEDIVQYAIAASTIVKELSSYSRQSRDESQSTVDLASAMEYSLKMAKHSASFTAIEVATNLNNNCYIFANEGELRQVFVNLVVNASHAMATGGVLTLECRRDGDFIVVKISDTGHGIPKENLNHIFEPFFTTKPEGSGTGLGLFVVYKIVTKYDGTIDIDSKEGTGTTFTMKFPAVKMASIASNDAEPQGLKQKRCIDE